MYLLLLELYKRKLVGNYERNLRSFQIVLLFATEKETGDELFHFVDSWQALISNFIRQTNLYLCFIISHPGESSIIGITVTINRTRNESFILYDFLNAY